MDDPAPLWLAILTGGGFVVVVSGTIWLSLWAQGRRRGGVEASTTNAEGADAMVAGQNPGHM